MQPIWVQLFGCVPAQYSIALIHVLPRCCASMVDVDTQVTYGLYGLDVSVGHMLYVPAYAGHMLYVPAYAGHMLYVPGYAGHLRALRPGCLCWSHAVCSCMPCSICFVQWCCAWPRWVLTIYYVCVQGVPLAICHTCSLPRHTGCLDVLCSTHPLSTSLAVQCTPCPCIDTFMVDMLYICTQCNVVCMRYVCTLPSGSCSF